MLTSDQCWEAVQKRDAAQDGRFYFGVLTTGVYCRPSCPARPALRKNVRFYESPAEAQRAGLRPCLRCRPLAAADPNAARIATICRYIEAHSEEASKAADLAAKAGLSLHHFARSFKAITGVTPKQYTESARLQKLKTGLRTSNGVAAAIYDAGYGSSSRVYERADTRLGMTPKQYREGGFDVAITHVTVESPFGPMMVGATDRGLCFVQFGESGAALLETLRREYPAARMEPMREPYPTAFRGWMDALNRHLAGAQAHLDLPLDIRASAFQMRVWKYLQSIPYGEVRSYSEVAAGIGQPSAARAVARACATNNVAILIPCHRVIRGTGELGGYRGGLASKRALIDRERSAKARAI